MAWFFFHTLVCIIMHSSRLNKFSKRECFLGYIHQLINTTIVLVKLLADCLIYRITNDPNLISFAIFCVLMIIIKRLNWSMSLSHIFIYFYSTWDFMWNYYYTIANNKHSKTIEMKCVHVSKTRKNLIWMKMYMITDHLGKKRL